MFQKRSNIQHSLKTIQKINLHKQRKMSASSSNASNTTRLNSDQPDLLYQVIVFLYCLVELRKGNIETDPSPDSSKFRDEKELFKDFIDKLCYVCDYKRAGKTVSSIMLLLSNSSRDEVVYYLASNEKDPEKGQIIAHYLQRLFNLVNRISRDPSNPAVEDVNRRKLLAEILVLNKEKLFMYIGMLATNIPLCLQSETVTGNLASKEIGALFHIKSRNYTNGFMDRSLIDELRAILLLAKQPLKNDNRQCKQ